MRKFLFTILCVQALSLSSAFAEQSLPVENVIDGTDGVINPLYRSCDDPYLGWRETCRTNGTTCPPGYEGTPITCKGSNGWYRCGTICESIYRG